MLCLSARRLRPVLAAALLLAPACSNTPSPTDVPRALITLAVDPNPIAAASTTQIGATFSARYKVVIKELAGQGGEVQAVNATLYDDVTGVEVGIVNYDAADLVVFLGQKRVEANGSLEVPQQIDYTIPGDPAAKAARLSVAIQFKDDRANTLRSSILVKVQ